MLKILDINASTVLPWFEPTIYSYFSYSFLMLVLAYFSFQDSGCERCITKTISHFSPLGTPWWTQGFSKNHGVSCDAWNGFLPLWLLPVAVISQQMSHTKCSVVMVKQKHTHMNSHIPFSKSHFLVSIRSPEAAIRD